MGDTLPFSYSLAATILQLASQGINLQSLRCLSWQSFPLDDTRQGNDYQDECVEAEEDLKRLNITLRTLFF